VVPNAGEETYFQRVRTLANAKKVTITRITPYYGEGVYGKTPTNDEPPKFFLPLRNWLLWPILEIPTQPSGLLLPSFHRM
jgi:hypothetical protein